MAEQAHVSFRCPADILDALKKATAGGAQRSTVITDALRIGLGLTPPGGAGRPQDLQGILDRLTDLEATTRQHEQLVGGLAQLAQRVRVVEDRVRFKAIPTPSPEEENKRPHALEADATSGTNPMQSAPAPQGRLTARQAFVALGGNPDDEGSMVASLSGKKRVRWNTFRLVNQTDYTLFGFEVDQKYRDANPKKPDWLVPATMPAAAQAPTLFSLEGM